MLRLNVILPSQHFMSRGKLIPERRLMVAVLQDAVECIAKHRFAKSGRRQRLFNEVRQWLLSEQADWPYSFVRICEVLDLDADAVRRELGLVPEPPPAAASGDAPGAMR
jgi:hypothetical protein